MAQEEEGAPTQHMPLTEHKQKFPSLRCLSCSRGPRPPAGLSTLAGSPAPRPAHTYQLADAVQHQVDALLAHRVVAPGIVVSCVLFSRDQLLRMEEVAVRSGPNLIYGERATISLTPGSQRRHPPPTRTHDTPIY